MSKEPKVTSKIVTVLVLIYAVTATIFTISMAATNFSVKTPFVSDLYATPSDLKVEALNFKFNVYTNRYDNVTVDVKNYDNSQAHSGTVHVTLYSSDGLEIASGSAGTGTISPGVRLGNIVVQLNWLEGYTVQNFSYGKVTLIQTS